MKINAIVQSTIWGGDKLVLQACIPFTLLMQQTQFTFRRKPEEDPYGEDQKYYQRDLNIRHLDDIERYLRKSILQMETKPTAVFPTSMLVAFTTDQTFELTVSRQLVELEIPYGCYIVDGQHRLKAMINLWEKCQQDDLLGENRTIRQFLRDYCFNCTLLLNFDLWEQSKIFADVNFTQKKVSKSLYYDIYGSLPPRTDDDLRQNAIYLAHSLVEYLNNSPKSPLYDEIRMLGKGKGVVSQSFLVESLLRHISSPRGIWYQPKYTPENLKLMKVEMLSYLYSIGIVFTDLWVSEKSIMRKTTGLGALIRLMGYLHKRIDESLLQERNIDADSLLCRKYIDEVKSILWVLRPYEMELFSTDKSKGASFAGTGGLGLEIALYKRIIEILKTTESK